MTDCDDGLYDGDYKDLIYNDVSDEEQKMMVSVIRSLIRLKIVVLKLKLFLTSIKVMRMVTRLTCWVKKM